MSLARTFGMAVVAVAAVMAVVGASNAAAESTMPAKNTKNPVRKKTA
jgi:hypothetical protein